MQRGAQRATLTAQPSTLAWSIHSIASMWSIPGSSPISFAMVMPASLALETDEQIIRRIYHRTFTRALQFDPYGQWNNRKETGLLEVSTHYRQNRNSTVYGLIVKQTFPLWTALLRPPCVPLLKVFHGRAEVAGCHHVDLLTDAVFGHRRVMCIRQQAEENKHGPLTETTGAHARVHFNIRPPYLMTRSWSLTRDSRCFS